MRESQRTLLLSLLLSLTAACSNDETGSGLPDGGMLDGGVIVSDGGDGGSSGPQLIITTQRGQIEGSLSDGVRAHLGIPFAAPPIGERRWKAPVPPEPWTGVRKATEYGPICAQNNFAGTAFDLTSKEDCLYLNVWSPAEPGNTPLPVMVWIYGGAYVFGSGGPPYNGEKLVKEGNVVLVTMNYRLGPLGYLAHPGVSAEAGASGAKANFGVLDQRLALEWVRDNIAAFGGDKSNVTLFGESAGGNSVATHLLAEPSWPLFHKAIVESGLVFKPALTLAEAEAQGSRLATALSCTQPDPAAALACLRGLTADQVTYVGRTNFPAAGGIFFQQSGRANVFLPVIDDLVLKEQPEEAFKAGRAAKIPIIHGITSHEGELFQAGIFGDRAATDLADYQASLENRFGTANAAIVMERYPAYATDLANVSADAVFRCPNTRLAKYFSNHAIKNYLYRFALPLNATLPQLANKSFHSSELPYVFGNAYALGSVPTDKTAYSRTLMGYWTRFAKTGDPNGGGAPTWAPYDNTSHLHLNLADPIVEGNDLATGCEFWENIPIIAP